MVLVQVGVDRVLAEAVGLVRFLAVVVVGWLMIEEVADVVGS